MTATSALLLGDFEFQDFEIPSSINFGGVQAIRRHLFVGPKKALDVMGPDDDPIQWEGRFRGAGALERAQRLDAMRKLGLEYTLTWRTLAYTVIVEEFATQAFSHREIGYRIKCQVVRDDAAPPPAAAPPSADEMIRGDLTTSEKLTDLLHEAELDEQMDVLRDAANGVPDFTTAGRDVLSSVLRPVMAVRETIGGLIGGSESLLTGVQAVGGVIAGHNGRDLVADLLAQTGAMTDAADLYDASAFLGRIETNVSAVANSGARVITAGADLFRLAQTAYGDASEWATIARANGLTDPMLDGIREIVIPPTPADTEGVLR